MSARGAKHEAAPLPGRALFAGLLVLIVWLPLPWGSNRPAAVAAFGAAVSLLLLGWLAGYLRGTLPAPQLTRAARVGVALWLLWLGWIAVQLLALPPARLAQWSPHAAALHAAVAELPGGAPRNTLSILPSATFEHLLESLGYFCLYLLVLFLAGARERVRLVLGALVLSGLFQALYGVIMTLSGLEYGFFAKKPWNWGSATGTFVNRNHLAGYLELCMAAGIGLVLTELGGPAARTWKQRAREFINLLFSTKMRVRVFLAIMVIGLVMTRSRMGNTAFFVALVACGTLYLLLRNREQLGRGLIFFLSLLLVDLLIVSRWFGLEEVVERIESTELASEERFIAFRDYAPAIDDYLWTGSGLGSFAAAYAPYRSAELQHYFDHAHNDYAQFLIETGVIGCALLAALVLAHLLHALRVLVLRHDRVRAGAAFAALMAMAAIGAHSVVEFNLQIPAIAGTLVVLLALLAASPSQSRRSRPRPRAEPARTEATPTAAAGETPAPAA